MPQLGVEAALKPRQEVSDPIPRMTATPRSNHGAQPGVSHAIPVRCELPDGTARMLVARDVTLVGAWIRSMRPPPAGTVIGLTLAPSGQTPLEALRGVVTSSYFDPSDASKTGFEVLFLDIDDEALEALSQLVWGISDPSPARFERRLAPRVPVAEEVRVTCQGRECAAIMHDISMSGAFIEIQPQPQPLQVGDELSLVLGPEKTKVRCSVARLDAACHGLGVQFLGLTAEASDHVEMLMLECLNRGVTNTAAAPTPLRSVPS